MTTFAFPVHYIASDSRSSLTAFNVLSENPFYQADESHPHWDEIVQGLRKGDPNVWDLFEVSAGVMARFTQITDRVSYNGSEILWDGDPIHSVLAEQLERVIRSGDKENYVAVAKFWEKLESNPNAHSREQAFDFLAGHKFQITKDGDVVGYKGMRHDGESFTSAWASQVPGKPSAFVNGVPQPELSCVRQNVGDVVSMPRSEVTHDPTKACERGLHVATRDYAASYGTVAEVVFNPRDIVSVPTADHGAKVRVCRYTVTRLAPPGNTDDHSSPVLNSESTSWAGDVGTAV